MKKTLLFVTSSLSYGGAAKVLCFVATSLGEMGYDVHIANIMSTDTKVEQKLPDYITVHAASSDMRRGVRRLNQLAKVTKIAKNIGADVIIGFTYYPNLIASIVGKKLQIKSIISERGDPYTTIGNDVASKLLLSVINSASGAVFQTDGAMQFYGRKLRERGRVIPNPIFLPAEGVPERNTLKIKKTVVSVGRLHNAQKRCDVMIKAFSLFSETHPEYVLRLIGDGPDERAIRDLCRDLKIEDKVCFEGKSKQPMKDIVNDGMFLITSDYEGISNALLEAMAVGLPCVSTDHSPGGGRFLITNRKNGLLAPTGNIEKLAEAMCLFAEDKSFAESCGRKAKEVTTRFAPEKIIEEWDAYIMKVCGK